MNDIRHYLNLIEETTIGHNGGPAPITLEFDGKSMGDKVYRIMQGGNRLGIAYGKYRPPKPGYAGATTFSAELKGKKFFGSRARLLTWVEKLFADDV